MVESTDWPTSTHVTSSSGGDADVSRGVAIGAMGILAVAIAMSLFAVMRADALAGLGAAAIDASAPIERPPGPSAELSAESDSMTSTSSTLRPPITTVLTAPTLLPTVSAPARISITTADTTTTAPPTTAPQTTALPTTAPQPTSAPTTSEPSTTTSTELPTTTVGPTTTTTIAATTTTTTEAPLPVSQAVVGATDAFVEVGQTKARIHWVASPDSRHTGFRVSRVAGGDEQTKEVGADRTSYEFVDLQPDTRYELTLLALGPSGSPVGGPPHTVTIRTRPSGVGAPKPVTNLAVYPGADGRSATVTWDAADDPAATGFFVSWGCCGSYIDGRFVGESRRSYTITGLTPGVEHTFDVLVRGPDLETDESPQGTRVTKRVTLPG